MWEAPSRREEGQGWNRTNDCGGNDVPAALPLSYQTMNGRRNHVGHSHLTINQAQLEVAPARVAGRGTIEQAQLDIAATTAVDGLDLTDDLHPLHGLVLDLLHGHGLHRHDGQLDLRHLRDDDLLNDGHDYLLNGDGLLVRLDGLHLLDRMAVVGQSQTGRTKHRDGGDKELRHGITLLSFEHLDY